MKKIITLTLAVFLLLQLTSCHIRKEGKELGPLGGSSRSPAGAGVGAEGFPQVD